MCDGSDFHDGLLGLPGFRVTAMVDDGRGAVDRHRNDATSGWMSGVRGDREHEGLRRDQMECSSHLDYASPLAPVGRVEPL